MVSASVVTQGAPVGKGEGIPHKWFEYPREFEAVPDEECLKDLKQITWKIVKQNFNGIV